MKHAYIQYHPIRPRAAQSDHVALTVLGWAVISALTGGWLFLLLWLIGKALGL